ncbi:MAG: hypothetical protein EOO43_02835 [Flavobacterium sp.]|nr:MAG: hypothetical protein EOO43_02835 [Flavobacterium sp.]
MDNIVLICDGNQPLTDLIQQAVKNLNLTDFKVYDGQYSLNNCFENMVTCVQNGNKALILLDTSCSLLSVTEFAEELNCSRHHSCITVLILMPIIDVPSIDVCYRNHLNCYVIDTINDDTQYLVNHMISYWHKNGSMPQYTKPDLSLSYKFHNSELSFEL